MIRVTMFPASYGDSLLVELVHLDRKINILIDCGFADTFNSYIKPKLEGLNDKGENLERLIITHLDRDHINGAKTFLALNGKTNESLVIPIRQIWHNTFRHMQSKNVNAARPSGIETEKLKLFIKENQTEIPALAGNISSKTSSELGALILNGNYGWNTDFAKKAAATDIRRSINISDAVDIYLLGPNRERLEDVEYLFKKSLFRIGIDLDKTGELVDDAFEVYIRNKDFDQTVVERFISKRTINKKLSAQDVLELAQPKYYEKDTAEPNGSSISFILTQSDKQLLFLADSFAEDTLEEINHLNEHDGFFNLIKISHHGALKNTSPDLLARIDSERFLISTNGNHPAHIHPDPETIARIVSRPLRDGKGHRKLFFNYETPTSKLFDSEALKKHFKYELEIGTEVTL